MSGMEGMATPVADPSSTERTEEHPSTPQRAQQILDQLKEMLSDDNVALVSSAKLTSLDAATCRTIQNLAKQLHKPSERFLDFQVEEAEGGESDDSEDERPQKRKRTALSRWARFVKIKKLVLPECIAKCAAGNNAKALMLDSRGHGQDLASVQDDSADAFLASLRYVEDAERGEELYPVRRILSDLALHMYVRQLGSSQGKATRIGPKMEQDMKPRIKAILAQTDQESIDSGNRLTEERAIELIKHGNRRGRHLYEFCAEFGPGALLYFGGQFTKSFLEKKWSGSGEDWSEARTHLHAELGLKELAESSGANAVARKALDMICRPLIQCEQK